MENREERRQLRMAQRQKAVRRQKILLGVGSAAVVLAIVLFVVLGSRPKGEQKDIVPVVTPTESARQPDTSTVSSTGQPDASTVSLTRQPDTSGTDQTPTAEPLPQSESDRRALLALDPDNKQWNEAETGEKVMYLTFDDGPSPYTPQVLEILNRYGVKATFFITAQRPDCFEYIKQVYDSGNTIGLHTYSHDYPEVYASKEAYFADLEAIGQVAKQHIGYVPAIIRFPGGSSNETSKLYCEGIMSEIAPEVLELGYQYWDWNAVSGDGAEDVTAEDEVKNALSFNQNTIVMLLHDGDTKANTVEALPKIIEGFLNQGYTFKVLDRNATVIHHAIAN